MPHPMKIGKNERLSFSKIKQVIEMPNLIEIQTKSFEWFKEEGIMNALRDISPIYDFSKDLLIEFKDHYFDKLPKYSEQECKQRDVNYAVPLRVKVKLTNKITGEIKEQDVFMGDMPIMTKNGTFIINGAERVIVSQLVRSPSAYYSKKYDKSGVVLFEGQIIPNRGAWLEYDTDNQEALSVRIDRTRKLPLTALVRILGYPTDASIVALFGESERLYNTIEKDVSKSHDEGLIEIYKKLRPGEPCTVESASSLITSMLFDPKRYDLARVGRFKYNTKLNIISRIKGKTLNEDIFNVVTGEKVASKGEVLTKESATNISNAGVNRVELLVNNKKVVVVGNNTVDIDSFVEGVDKDIINEKVYFPLLKEIMDNTEEENLLEELYKNIDELIPYHATAEDILASVSYFINLSQGIGEVDDIDHLSNRRIRSVGELLQNQFRIGLSRVERGVRERFSTLDIETLTPQQLINIKPVTAAIKEFFGSSQLSQFMDQNNPLAELTHKRRLSALGPGGLSRDRASFEVRDVHYSHYGRMCPIETPEGPNIGLISYLSTYAKINQYGFIESPFRIIDKKTGVVTDEYVYLSAQDEENAVIVPANEPLDEKSRIINERVVARCRSNIKEFSKDEVDFMEISAQQMVSIATALIPFLENDDSVRALMGSNMQKQAVPLIKSKAPIIGTGIEYKVAKDSGSLVIAKNDGEVIKATADEVIIRRNKSKELDKYKLVKFQRSNQGTCMNHKTLVSKGDKVLKGDILCDGTCTDNGDLALGTNLLVAFMTWEGYNFEDAILISEDLVKDDTLTSIHIEEYECETRDTKLGPEEITRELHSVSEQAVKNLDSRGVVRIGAEVKSNDILVGKITPKGETDATPHERILRAIFGKKANEARDTSLKVPHGSGGIVVDVKYFSRKNNDEMTPGVNEVVRVYIAKKRKISVGDKMAGRHGNKGVISMILPKEDMPFLDDGTPVQVVLSPLGIPSRMNIGQVLEVHLGLAADKLNKLIATPVFDGANEIQIENTLEEVGFSKNGKLKLRDGRTGEYFDNPVTVGYMYMLKLHHLVDDKIHARSTGPYSLVTQQPLGGKAQFGGQRFGEMEVWALEAYGAAHTLQEILTVKSDDVEGRSRAYDAIVKGEDVPTPGIPEAFKVLIKEIQSIALDVSVLDKDGEEINLNKRFSMNYPRNKLISYEVESEEILTKEDSDALSVVEEEE